MSELPRITPEGVIEALTEQGIMPTSGVYIKRNEEDEIIEGCGAGAMALQHGFEPAPKVFVHNYGLCLAEKRMWAIYGEQYMRDYEFGFDRGFNGVIEEVEEPEDKSNRRRLGYFDGVQCGVTARKHFCLEVPDYVPELATA